MRTTLLPRETRIVILTEVLASGEWQGQRRAHSPDDNTMTISLVYSHILYATLVPIPS